MNQLYVYILPLVYGFPSHLSHHRALSRFPELHSRFSLVIKFIHNWVCLSNPISQLIPPSLSSLGVPTLVLFIGVSVSVYSPFSWIILSKWQILISDPVSSHAKKRESSYIFFVRINWYNAETTSCNKILKKKKIFIYKVKVVFNSTFFFSTMSSFNCPFWLVNNSKIHKSTEFFLLPNVKCILMFC